MLRSPLRRTMRAARTPAADALSVFGLAVAARLSVVLASGGFGGNYGYDASVYYAAADGLTHGRWPYRDFVLLHPPGLMLVLTPFAWLGRLTSDHTGFAAASLGFICLGALNAVLVLQVGRAMDLGRWPAVLGGGFYAVWFGSVQAEYLPRLEPLGNFFLLCGLLAFVSAERSGRGRYYACCGAALGAACSVKIWWSVPLAVVLVWLVLVRRRMRPVLLAGAGAVAAMLAVDGPFFLHAPHQMWSMVIAEQVGRAPSSLTAYLRWSDLTGVHRLWPGTHRTPVTVALLLLAVGAVALAVLSWSIAAARIAVVLTVAQLALLLLAPSYFDFYSDFAAPALALVLAGGASALGVLLARRRAQRWATLVWLAPATAAALTAFLLGYGRSNAVQPFPGRQLAAAVATLRCVQADSPMALIELDALSRDFANGCQVWVDVTGRTYGVDKPPPGTPLSRPDNRKWQRDLRAYLLCGDAALIIRADGTGPSRATTAAVASGGVLATAGNVTVYRTPHAVR